MPGVQINGNACQSQKLGAARVAILESAQNTIMHGGVFGQDVSP